MTRPITERMAEAKATIIARRQAPRCFYLCAADYTEFRATKPPTVKELFALPLGSKPRPMVCLGFEGIAVRESLRQPNKRGLSYSNLICRRGTTVNVRPQ